MATNAAKDGLAGPSVLVIDDDKNIRSMLVLCLEGVGCTVATATSAKTAVAALERRSFDLALLDLKLGDDDGMTLLPQLIAARPGLAVVVMTAQATIDTGVEAMKRGATDFLAKPFSPVQIRHLVTKTTSRRAVDAQVANLEAQLATEVPDIDISTESPLMRDAIGMARRVAPSDAPVLLRGENGTGKSVLARVIHASSRRATRPWMSVNCPTLSEDLLTSELFGHTIGSFTGAIRDQPGRVEAAEGGTLMLDEIGEISPTLQAKLLRFVQEKEFSRIGEARTRYADVRVIAATNRNLEADVIAGRFREDLLFRLNVVEIVVPALRERPDDILPMAQKFLDFFSKRANRPAPTLSETAQGALLEYRWPGNVRELRNAMERATILYPNQMITPEILPGRIAARASVALRLGGDFTLDQIEREHVERVVARSTTLDDAAKVLGIDTSTLYRKRRRFDG